MALLGKKSKVADVKQLSSQIDIVDSLPAQAYLDGEGRIGAIRFAIKGLPPKNLIVHISENFSAVNESNATWTFHKPTVFTILPRDQKITNPRKASASDFNKFQRLFLAFETEADECQFRIEVSFPDEEEHERRRRVASDQLNMTIGGNNERD